MKETKFIEQNKEKWLNFEKILLSKHKNADEITNLFIEITEDLSYSRTHYPHRTITVFLNGLAQRVFLKLYKARSSKKNRFAKFWLHEIPLVVYEYKMQLLLAFATFLLAFIIGWFSSVHEPTFVTQILGKEYVEQTIENIKSGDPMAIYKDKNELDMFFGIALNNIRVSFLCFLSGLLVGIGSIFVLLQNGIMLGAFLQFFNKYNLSAIASITVWQHGTLEISAIIISGAAGIVLGRGLVFRESFTRMQSFYISAQRSAKLFISVIPILVIAAIIESFITRYTNINLAFRLATIILSLGFLIFYYIYLPFRLGYKQKKEFENKVHIFHPEEVRIKVGAVKSFGTILNDTFSMFRKHVKQIATFAAALSLVSLLLISILTFNSFFYLDSSVLESGSFNPFGFLSPESPISIIILAILLIICAVYSSKLVSAYSTNSKPNFLQSVLRPFSNLILFAIIFYVTFYSGLSYLIAIFIIVSPILIYISSLTVIEGLGFNDIVKRTGFLMSQSLSTIYGLFVMISILSVIIGFIFYSPFLYFYKEFFFMHLPNINPQYIYLASCYFMGFISLFLLVMFLSLLFLGSSLIYFRQIEILEAPELKEIAEKIILKGAKR